MRATTHGVIPELAAIELGPPMAGGPSPAGVFAAAGPTPTDVLLTGADARLWYSHALDADDLVFAVWPHPSQPLVVYAGDRHASVLDRLTGGTLVLVAGGGLGLDVAYVTTSRVDTAPGVAAFFGLDQVVVSREAPRAAAGRRVGGTVDGAAMLAANGSTITIRAGAGTVLGGNVAPYVRSSFTVARPGAGPTVVSRVAWTRALGTFQIREVDSLADAPLGAQGDLSLDSVIGGAAGPVATLHGGATAHDSVATILSGQAGTYDVIAAAAPGGITTFVTDVALALGEFGPVIVTGMAVPPRSAVVLRGAAAEAAQPHLDGRRVEPDAVVADPIVLGPPPVEDHDRFEAHQWATAQVRAESALAALGEAEPRRPGTATGPADFTLATEAAAVGLIGPHVPTTPTPGGPDGEPARQAVGTVGSETVEAIAYARGWHVIDPALPPVLDTVLADAHRQIRGSDESVDDGALGQVRQWAADPGFWERLPAATEPVVPSMEHVIVFPYPTVTVDLLRAVLAADGEGRELRRLLGPIKVAVLAGFAEGPPNGGPEGGGDA